MFTCNVHKCIILCIICCVIRTGCLVSIVKHYIYEFFSLSQVYYYFYYLLMQLRLSEITISYSTILVIISQGSVDDNIFLNLNIFTSYKYFQFSSRCGPLMFSVHLIMINRFSEIKKNHKHLEIS